MKGRFVVDGNFFARLDVAQSDKKDVAVGNFHKGVGLARMVNVMRAVPSPAAIEAPAIIDRADA